MQVRYANIAFGTYNDRADAFWHVQVVESGGAFFANGPVRRPVQVENALVVNQNGGGAYIFRSYNTDWQVEHLTVRGGDELFQQANSYTSLTLRNSVLVELAEPTGYIDGGGNWVFSSAEGVFETAPSGSCYLP
ncbi:MAG: hypothetical protein H5T92_08120, partial [Synergistales bacterium]|nr:hypothetical protein [Synergistales bacterium]